jgi:hypothetical protein
MSGIRKSLIQEAMPIPNAKSTHWQVILLEMESQIGSSTALQLTWRLSSKTTELTTLFTTSGTNWDANTGTETSKPRPMILDAAISKRMLSILSSRSTAFTI